MTENNNPTRDDLREIIESGFRDFDKVLGEAVENAPEDVDYFAPEAIAWRDDIREARRQTLIKVDNEIIGVEAPLTDTLWARKRLVESIKNSIAMDITNLLDAFVNDLDPEALEAEDLSLATEDQRKGAWEIIEQTARLLGAMRDLDNFDNLSRLADRLNSFFVNEDEDEDEDEDVELIEEEIDLDAWGCDDGGCPFCCNGGDNE